jgi:hypothetical protein
MRLHRIPCHRRGNHRWFPAPCSSEPASHQIRSIVYYEGPQKMIAVRNPAADADMLFAGVSARPPPVRSSVPTAVRTLVTYERTGVCARISIRYFRIPHQIELTGHALVGVRTYVSTASTFRREEKPYLSRRGGCNQWRLSFLSFIATPPNIRFRRWLRQSRWFKHSSSLLAGSDRARVCLGEPTSNFPA